MDYKNQINHNKLPSHIAVIMDGNGRWAKQNGKSRVFGHRSAVKSVRETTEACAELGIPFLTLYAFSTENWNRPKLEIDALMQLLVTTLKKEVATLNKNNIRLQAIGNLESLPRSCRNELQSAIKNTSGNTRMTLVLALSYSSKWEITDAVKKVAKDIEEGRMGVDQINEESFRNYFVSASIPDPELLIRTSGEHRISNFLLWQLAYTELYFTEKLWPDFRKADLYEAIWDFQQRERRFGKISEQIALE